MMLQKMPLRIRGATSRTVAFMTIDEISDNFSLLDEWEDRYRYIIELGRTLAPLPAEAHIDANKVQGCARLCPESSDSWYQIGGHLTNSFRHASPAHEQGRAGDGARNDLSRPGKGWSGEQGKGVRN